VSSRRRHTRSKRDWSSDVCSSDLRGLVKKRLPVLQSGQRGDTDAGKHTETDTGRTGDLPLPAAQGTAQYALPPAAGSGWGTALRSEERRVGKEGGCR